MKRPHGRQTKPAAKRRDTPTWARDRKWQRRLQRAVNRAEAMIALTGGPR